jgi:hypothetical protein
MIQAWAELSKEVQQQINTAQRLRAEGGYGWGFAVVSGHVLLLVVIGNLLGFNQLSM